MKSGKTGLARILAAYTYSIAGLKSAFRYEAAFRQEVILYLILLPVIFLLPVDIVMKCLLFSANSLVLIVELLNSSIEAIVDLASPDYDIYAKRAKDMGSAAVFLSLLLALFIWGCTALDLFHML